MTQNVTTKLNRQVVALTNNVNVDSFSVEVFLRMNLREFYVSKFDKEPQGFIGKVSIGVLHFGLYYDRADWFISLKIDGYNSNLLWTMDR